MKGLILTGGKGTPLRPLTASRRSPTPSSATSASSWETRRPRSARRSATDLDGAFASSTSNRMRRAASRLILETFERRIDGTVDDGRSERTVVIEKGAIVERSMIRGPAIIGCGARITHAYVGPFTSIGNDVEIKGSEIEHSIVLEGSYVRDLANRIIDSLIGKNVRIYREPVTPSAYRFMQDDNSEVGI